MPLFGRPPASAGDPFLSFSDLISGPDTGIGDGNGSGAIVTVWGFNLGSSQGSSKLVFTDSGFTEYDSPHIYYWQNADGTLPGGPADLYESHGMQEICFSVPNCATGNGTIHVEVDGEDSNDLPFLVRTGNIYHIKSTGNDSTGDGSFNSPYQTLQVVDHPDDGGVLAAGDIFYAHDIDAGTAGTTGIVAGITGEDNNGTALHCDTTNQMALVQYPSASRGTLEANWCFRCLNVEGFVFSKLNIIAADNGDNDDGCLDCTNDGRIVANYVGEDPSFPRTAGDSGAIKSGRPLARDPGIDNVKVIGNHIEDFGNSSTTRLQHVTYFKLRENGTEHLTGNIEVRYNYFQNCGAQNGVHFHHSSSSFTLGISGDVYISDNVIVNQLGSGIAILFQGTQFSCDWYIYNNIIINAGGQTGGGDPRWGSGMVFEDDHSGDEYVYNNIIYEWDPDDKNPDTNGAIDYDRSSNTTYLFDNIFYTTNDKNFIYDDQSGGTLDLDNNAWIYVGAGSPSKAVTPSGDTNAVDDETGLVISQSGSQLTLTTATAIANLSPSTANTLTRDIYGALRGATYNLGAIG